MTDNKTFGFWTLTFLVIANMVGAGVFTTSGFSLQDLGSPHYVVLAWAVGGLIALAGAYSYGQLVKAMPESGGEYMFLSRAAHPALGFIAGWVSLIAGFSGAIAFAATAFEGYLLPERIHPAWLPQGSLAILVIILSGACHGWRPGFGMIAQNAAVLLKLLLLAALIGFAALKLTQPAGFSFESPKIDTGSWAFASAFAGSLVWISLSYSGFNAAVYVAGEAVQARRTVPRALLVGTGIVWVLYLLLNAVFVYAAPIAAIQGQEDVAAIAAKYLGGPGLETFVRIAIALCLLTSVMSMMMAAPRVYAKMAEDGFLPRQLQIQGRSPSFATGLQVIVAVFLVLVSTLQGLLSYLGLTLSLSAACSVSCLFLPGVRTQRFWHFANLPPLIYLVGTLAAAALMTTFQPWNLVGAAATFALGATAYMLIQSQQKPGPQPQPEDPSLHRPHQQSKPD